MVPKFGLLVLGRVSTVLEVLEPIAEQVESGLKLARHVPLELFHLVGDRVRQGANRLTQNCAGTFNAVDLGGEDGRGLGVLGGGVSLSVLTLLSPLVGHFVTLESSDGVVQLEDLFAQGQSLLGPVVRGGRCLHISRLRSTPIPFAFFGSCSLAPARSARWLIGFPARGVSVGLAENHGLGDDHRL